MFIKRYLFNCNVKEDVFILFEHIKKLNKAGIVYISNQDLCNQLNWSQTKLVNNLKKLSKISDLYRKDIYSLNSKKERKLLVTVIILQIAGHVYKSDNGSLYLIHFETLNFKQKKYFIKFKADSKTTKKLLNQTVILTVDYISEQDNFINCQLVSYQLVSDVIAELV